MNDLYDVDLEKPSMLGKYFLGAELETILAYYTYSKLLHLFRFALSCLLFPKMNHLDVESFKPYQLEWRTLDEFSRQLFSGTLYTEKTDEYLVILPKLSFDAIFLKWFGSTPPKTMFQDFLGDPPEVIRIKRLWNLFFLMAECLELIEKRQNLDAVKQFPKFLDSIEQIFDLFFALDINIPEYLTNGLEFIFSQKDKVGLFLNLSSDKWSFDYKKLCSGMGFWLGVFISQLSLKTADNVFLKQLFFDTPKYLQELSFYVFNGLDYLVKQQPCATDIAWNQIQKDLEIFFLELHKKQIQTQSSNDRSQNILESLKFIYDLINDAVAQFGLLNKGLQIYLHSIIRVFKYNVLLSYLVDLDNLEINLFLQQGTLSNIFFPQIKDFYQLLVSHLSSFLSLTNEQEDIFYLEDEKFYQLRYQQLSKNHEKIIQEEFLIDKKIIYLSELKVNSDEKKQKSYAIALYADFQKVDSIECEQLFQSLWSDRIYYEDFKSLFDNTMKLLLSQKQGLILRRQTLKQYQNALEKRFLNPITVIQSKELNPFIFEQKVYGNYLLVIKENEVWVFDKSQRIFHKVDFFDAQYLLDNYSTTQNYPVLLDINDTLKMEEKLPIVSKPLNFSQQPEVLQVSPPIFHLRNTHDYLNQYAILIANLNMVLDLKVNLNNLFSAIQRMDNSTVIRLKYFKVRNLIASLIPDEWKDFEHKLLENLLIDKNLFDRLMVIINHKIDDFHHESSQLEIKLTQFYYQENLEAFNQRDYYLTMEGEANPIVAEYFQKTMDFFNNLEKCLCVESFDYLSVDEKEDLTQQLNSLLMQLNLIEGEPNLKLFSETSLDSNTPISLYQLKAHFFDIKGIESRWHWHDLRAGYALTKNGYAIKIEKILQMKEILFGKFNSFIQKNLADKEFYSLDSYQEIFRQPIQILELKELNDFFQSLKEFFEKVENYPSSFNILQRTMLIPFRKQIEIVKAFFKFHNLFFFYVRSDSWKPFVINKSQQLLNIKNACMNELRQHSLQVFQSPMSNFDQLVYWFMILLQYLENQALIHNPHFQKYFYLELSKQLQDILSHTTSSLDIVLRAPKIIIILIILRNKSLQLMDALHQNTLANVKNLQVKLFLDVLVEIDAWELQLGFSNGTLSQFIYQMVSELFYNCISTLQLNDQEIYNLLNKTIFIDKRINALNEHKKCLELEKKQIDQKLNLIAQFRQEVNDYICGQHKSFSKKVCLRKTFLDLLPVLEKYKNYRHYPTLMPLTTEANRTLHILLQELSEDHLIQEDLNIPELIDFTESKLLGEQVSHIFYLNGLQEKLEDLNLFANQISAQVAIEQKEMIKQIYQKHVCLILHELTHEWKNCSFLYDQYFSFLSSTLNALEQGMIDDICNEQGIKNNLVSIIQDKLLKAIQEVTVDCDSYQALCHLWLIMQQFQDYLNAQESIVKNQFHAIESFELLKLKQKKLIQLEVLISNDTDPLEKRLQDCLQLIQDPVFKNILLAHHHEANGIFEKCWQFLYLFLEWLGLIKSKRHEIFLGFLDAPIEKVNLQLSKQGMFSSLTSRLTVQELKKQQSAIFIT